MIFISDFTYERTMRILFPLLFIIILGSIIIQIRAKCCYEAFFHAGDCKGYDCNPFCCGCSRCDDDFRGYTSLGYDIAMGTALVAGVVATAALATSAAALCGAAAAVGRRKREILNEEQQYIYNNTAYTNMSELQDDQYKSSRVKRVVVTINGQEVTSSNGHMHITRGDDGLWYTNAYPVTTNAYPVGYYDVQDDCNSYSYSERKKREINTNKNWNWKVHQVTLAILKFRSVNTDRDGKIGFTEFLKYRPNGTRGEFTSMDSNGNGFIEPSEFDDTLEAWPSNHKFFTT